MIILQVFGFVFFTFCVCYLTEKRRQRKQKQKEQNNSNDNIFKDKYNKSSINPDSNYRKIVKLRGWWQHQIWRSMKWQMGILKEIWGMEWSVESSMIADNKDDYVLENQTKDGCEPPATWIDPQTGTIL